jgi:hypothetical protein
MNERGAEECENCGAELRRPREPRVEVAGRSLVEAVETPATDRDIANMGLRGALRWAADDRGYLKPERLVRVADVRGYRRGWVYYNAGKYWEDLWSEMKTWQQQQRKEART